MKSRQRSSRPNLLFIAGFLVLAVWIIFGRTVTYNFVNYDDGAYVYGNLVIRSGITWAGLVRAFLHSHANNWHPLTTISHMLDCQLFGLKPGAHHFVNVLWHTAAVLLLFFVLQRMTGGVWRSAFVAAVFAIHPLHVESVAWIAERKDVLGAMFFMLTLGVYERYVRERNMGWYLALLAVFACGLMAKPMLVTLPFVLLLLDYWPFRRFADRNGFGRALREKIPLFALSILSGLATVLAAKQSVGAMESLPFTSRISNAIVSCVIYIRQMIAPANLAVFYPYETFPLWQVTLSALLLLAITALAWVLRNTRPYILVGWLWYLGMLVPVIGIYQIGLQGHADRYTYLPEIGLYILIAWSIAELSIFRERRGPLFGFSAVVLIALGLIAWDQVSYWKNSGTLWTRTLAVTSDNDVAYNNLGLYFEEQHDLDEALAQFRNALKIESARGEARYSLSTALTHTNIANVLSAKGRLAEGVLHYQKALELRPDYGDGHYNFGRVLYAQGRIDDAIAEWQKTLSIQPNDGEAHTSLGNALLKKGLVREAIEHYEKAISSPLPSVFALNNLAWILSTAPDASLRNGAKAVELARSAVAISRGESPVFIRTLAMAHAESGHFDDAIATAERALQLARDQKDVDLANDIENDAALFRMHAPVRESGLKNAGQKP